MRQHSRLLSLVFSFLPRPLHNVNPAQRAADPPINPHFRAAAAAAVASAANCDRAITFGSNDDDDDDDGGGGGGDVEDGVSA